MKMDYLFSFHSSWLQHQYNIISTRKAIVYTLISAENNNYKETLNYAYINDAIFINYKEAIDLENQGL